MIKEQMNGLDFSISHDSEKKQYTLLKRVGKTWHRMILTEDEMSTIMRLMWTPRVNHKYWGHYRVVNGVLRGEDDFTTGSN